jgi:hypothetical protein
MDERQKEVGALMLSQRLANLLFEVRAQAELPGLDSTHPAGQWVPSGENLGHQRQTGDFKRPTLQTTSLSNRQLLEVPLCNGLLSRVGNTRSGLALGQPAGGVARLTMRSTTAELPPSSYV